MFERKFSQNLSSKTMLSLALVGVYWALMAFSAQVYARDDEPECLKTELGQACVQETGLNNVCREALDGEGNGDAMAYLAYEYGQKNNVEKQYYWASRGAELGSNGARTMLAAMLLKGEGVHKNEHEAVRLLKLATSETDLLEPRMLLASFYLEQAQPTPLELDTAVKLLEACMAQGDAGEAALYLGMQYLSGTKLELDYHKAAKLFARAIKDGEPKGLKPLALALLMGENTPQTLAKNAHRALILLNMAGEFGDNEAYKIAADIYKRGVGVKPNSELAAEYLARAGHVTKATANLKRDEEKVSNGATAIDGVQDELENQAGLKPKRRIIISSGRDHSDENTSQITQINEEIPSDDPGLGSDASVASADVDEARMVENTFASENVADSETPTTNFTPEEKRALAGDQKLALQFAHKYYKAQDYVKAREFIEFLAQGGDADGKLLLARLYRFGRGGLKQKPNVARVNYEFAANKGRQEANTELCYIYASHEFGEPNYYRAAKLCETSALAGNAYAALYMSRAYSLGHGKPQNPTLGYAWLKQAAWCLDKARTLLSQVEANLSATVKVNGRSEAKKLQQKTSTCQEEIDLELPEGVISEMLK